MLLSVAITALIHLIINAEINIQILTKSPHQIPVPDAASLIPPWCVPMAWRHIWNMMAKIPPVTCMAHKHTEAVPTKKSDQDD